jgi:hypothetical protein
MFAFCGNHKNRVGETSVSPQDRYGATTSFYHRRDVQWETKTPCTRAVFCFSFAVPLGDGILFAETAGGLR